MAKSIKKGDIPRRRGTSGIDRRDFLKYSALTGAAAGVASLTLGNLRHSSGGVAVAEAADKSKDSGNNRNWNFQVAIPDLPETSANIQSVQVEDLTIDVRDVTTDLDLDYRIYAPGNAHYGNVTIRARVGKNSMEMRQWLNDASVDNDIRKSISVVILKKDGTEARRYNLMECFPVSWDPGDYSPSATTQVETLVLKIGRVEFA